MRRLHRSAATPLSTLSLASLDHPVTVGADSVVPAVGGRPLMAPGARASNDFGFPGDGVDDECIC